MIKHHEEKKKSKTQSSANKTLNDKLKKINLKKNLTLVGILN